MLVHHGYRYRLYPTPEQETRLRAWEGALRFLWNVAHEQRLQAYSRPRMHRKYPTAVDQQRELTELRADLPWLADVPRYACAAVLVALDAAWHRCFEKAGGAPRWKRRGLDAVGVVAGDPATFRVEGEGRTGVLAFPKIGAIPAMIHRPLGGDPKRCTISRDGDQWFASVLCAVTLPDPVPATGPAVAIDRGVVHLLSDSNGRQVENPRHLDAMQRRIARAQRAVSKKVKGSKNREKAKAKVMRLHRKVRRQREAVLHVESKHYATQGHAAVVMDQRNVRKMTASAKGTVEEPGTLVGRKAKFNGAILGAAWGRFKELVQYKLVERGGRLVFVDPAYSSQTCAACGACDPASHRSQSEFHCTACGHTAHANVNTARVFLARAVDLDSPRSGGDAACGGVPIAGPGKQEGGAAKPRAKRRRAPLRKSCEEVAP